MSRKIANLLLKSQKRSGRNVDANTSLKSDPTMSESTNVHDEATNLLRESLERLNKQGVQRHHPYSNTPAISVNQVEQLLQSILSGNGDNMRTVLDRVADEQQRSSTQSSPTTCTSTSATAPCTMSVGSGDFYQHVDCEGNDEEALYLDYGGREGTEESSADEFPTSPETNETSCEDLEENDSPESEVVEDGVKWMGSPESGSFQNKDKILGRLSRRSGGTTGVVLELGDCSPGNKSQLSSSTRKVIPPPPPPPPPMTIPPPPSKVGTSQEVDNLQIGNSFDTDVVEEDEESADEKEEDEEEDIESGLREGFCMMKFLCRNLLPKQDEDEEIYVTPPPPEMNNMTLYMPFPHLHLEEFEHFNNDGNNTWSPFRRRKENDDVDGCDAEEEDDDGELGYSKWRFTQDEIEVIEEEFMWYKQCLFETRIANADNSFPSSLHDDSESNEHDLHCHIDLMKPEVSLIHHQDSLESEGVTVDEGSFLRRNDMFLFDIDHLNASAHLLAAHGSDEDILANSNITPLNQLSYMDGDNSDDGDDNHEGGGLSLYKLGCSHRELARSFSDEEEDEEEDPEGLDEAQLRELSVEYSRDMEDALTMLRSMALQNEKKSKTVQVELSQVTVGKETILEEEEEIVGLEEEYVEFNLPIVYEPHKTGLEPSPNLTLVEGSVVAGRYHVVAELGSAAFSTAYHCVDLKASHGENGQCGADVCLKVIQNSKDFLDQSLDEIKVLQTLQHGSNKGGFSTTTTPDLCDENHVLHLQRYFYYKEHLILVTELLQDNLYEFDKTLREAGQPRYFTLPRLCYITKQILTALDFVHSLDLIHCDVKPENIMMWSYRSAKVKLIDFGSACYSSDRLSSYIQSRSYRAPEVVLGLPYNSKIDIWSLGGVIAEMFTGQVLFQNESVIGMLARMEAICGPFPNYMKENGKKSSTFFLPSGLICERIHLKAEEEAAAANSKALKSDRRRLTKEQSEKLLRKYQCYDVYRPKQTSLEERLGLHDTQDESEILFVDFLKKMLSLDPEERPTARDALNHPWIRSWGESLDESAFRYRPKVAGISS